MNKLTIVYAMTLTVMFPICANSQGLSKTITSVPHTRTSSNEEVIKQLSRQYAWLHDRAWISEQWTGEEKPFRIIRATIDATLTSGIKPEALISKYKIASERSPSDPKALFRWGYTAYQAATQPGKTNSEGLGQLTQVRQDFPFAHSPHTYEYDRLRFLVQSFGFGSSDIARVGARLLKLHPNDDDVEYSYVKCLTDDPTRACRLQALANTRLLVRKNPNVPSVYALLATVYSALWASNNDKQYAAKAVEAYQEYLRKAPADFAYRKQAESNIAFIKAKMAQ